MPSVLESEQHYPTFISLTATSPTNTRSLIFKNSGLTIIWFDDLRAIPTDFLNLHLDHQY
jgi:hypothetical protein